jgi:hypothetical protein
MFMNSGEKVREYLGNEMRDYVIIKILCKL